MESKLGVLFLDGDGREDIWDYEGGGGGSVRLCACAQDLACSPYLANAVVTKGNQNKSWKCRPLLLFIAFVMFLICELCCISKALTVRKQRWQRNIG